MRRQQFLLTVLAAALFCGSPLATAQEKVGVNLQQKTYHSEFLNRDRAYWRYLPKGHGDDPARKWPVILFLHGNGERGDDVNLVLKHGPIKEVAAGRDLPFIIIAPQMPFLPEGTNPRPRNNRFPDSPERKSFVRVPTGDPYPWGPLGPPHGWHELEADLLLLVERALDENQGDPDRVYVTGLSYGGFGTWYMATHHSEVWAAAVPICGAGQNDEVHKIGTLPVWVFQGGRDPVVRPEWTLATADALDAVGGNVRVTVHEDCTHDCWTRVYEGQDIYTWMLSHKRGVGE